MSGADMPAGRELDALVAEKVMGFGYERVAGGDWTEYRMYGAEGPGGLWVIKTSDAPVKYMRGLPAYSTDIAAAWEVVERLRSLAFNVSVSCSDGMATWDVRGWHEDTGVRFIARDESVCVAICRAALATVESP